MRSLDLITDKNLKYLNIKNPTEARFYPLPKIHKKDAVDPYAVPSITQHQISVNVLKNILNNMCPKQTRMSETSNTSSAG